MSGPPSFYVYYRVADPNSTATRDCAAAVVDDVRAATGITGRLLCRCDDPGTWMEIYEHVVRPTEFDRVLTSAAEARGLGKHLAEGSRRVVERFEAL
jgi:hypothetical protein